MTCGCLPNPYSPVGTSSLAPVATMIAPAGTLTVPSQSLIVTSKLPMNPLTSEILAFLCMCAFGDASILLTISLMSARASLPSGPTVVTSQRSPPRRSVLSTRCVSMPCSTSEDAAASPESPPPMTTAAGSTADSPSVCGSSRAAFATPMATSFLAFSVASLGSFACIQEQCSLMLTNSNRYLLMPACSHARLKSGSCVLGVHAATPTPSSLFSVMLLLIEPRPSSEQE